MTIFLDTANVSELKERGALDVVDGVTTHPSLAVNHKRAFRPLVQEINVKVRGATAHTRGRTFEAKRS